MISCTTLTFNLASENTYIIWDEHQQACIIDPGCSNPQEEQRLVEEIERHQLTPIRCLCTHLHFDHVWGANFVLDKWGVSPECSHKEINELPSFLEQLKAFGVNSSSLKEVYPTPLKETAPGKVKVGNISMDVLHVPGHSPGHIAFYCEEDNILFSGDVLFREEIGRTDLWGGSYETLISSITTELYKLPKDTRVLSGHGPNTTIGHEIAHNPYTNKEFK